MYGSYTVCFLIFTWFLATVDTFPPFVDYKTSHFTIIFKATDLFKLGIVISNRFQVVFTVTFFVGNAVFCHTFFVGVVGYDT